MRKRQYGLSLSGLVFGSIVVILIVLVGLKLGPDYMEFFTAKKAIEAIARDNPGGTPIEIRKAFDARQAIDNMPSLTPNDLDITKQGGQTVIAFSYRKEIPLFANLGIYIDFQADSRGQ